MPLFNREVKVGDFVIGSNHPVFVIAEAGVNHNGNIELAKQLVTAAKEAGADAVKFQTFKAEHLNTPNAPKSTYHIETTGKEGSWFDLLKSQELDRKAHEILIDYCRREGIMFLSTPYDEESVDLLHELDVPAIKVASTDANNIPFLRYLACTQRPILLSTGMCSLQEVKDSVSAIEGEGNKNLVLFHCTANYPTDIKNVNLRAMNQMRDVFQVPVGYSDHTQSGYTPVAAVAVGAVAYEKHFTMDRNLPGPDHRASVTPSELKELIVSIRMAEKMLGAGEKMPMPSESENRQKLRKSIVTNREIKAGEMLTASNLAIKRPGLGIEPKYFDRLIGRHAVITIPKDALLKESDFK